MKSILVTFIGTILFVGCISKEPIPIIEERIVPTPQIEEVVKPIKEHIIKQKALPSAPKKKIKLKKVEDKNYSDKYMYPEDTKAAKKDPVIKSKTVTNTASVMTKTECISMISQEKFDKYTAMFGSEAASIKRCTMLKAMRK